VGGPAVDLPRGYERMSHDGIEQDGTHSVSHGVEPLSVTAKGRGRWWAIDSRWWWVPGQ
jgi:hypothetical protein